MSFHAHSGWFFERQDDGAVVVERREDNDQVVHRVRFDRHLWASIIASMSRDGESGGRFYRALEFHGHPEDVPEGA